MNPVNTPLSAPAQLHSQSPPPLWRITLLGGLAALSQDQSTTSITRFRSHKYGALLAYLAYYRHTPHSRETLIALLWPEMEERAGRNNLSVALSSLRNQLEPPGTAQGAVLRADRFSVGLSPAATTSDVTEFEGAIKEAAKTSSSAIERGQHLSRAIARYAGPLLPSYDENWITGERERLAGLFFDALGQFIQSLEAAGDLSSALSHARHGVRVDPLREEGHEHLIRLLAATGQPAAALRQYKELERLLDEEMADEPSAPLRALARRIEKETGERYISVTAAEQRSRHLPLVYPAATAAAATGTAAAAGAATMTFLLTDIEGITRLWEQLAPVREQQRTGGEATAAEFPGALVAHHSLIRDVIARHGGQEVNEAGDGFVVAFATAGQALRCAVAAQQALSCHAWPEATGPLPVRMAIHTGDVEFKDGAYHGLVLHRASRMLTAAHGGQVLLSETTASLVHRDLSGGEGNIRGDIRGDIRLVDLGVYRLRDVPAPERLFQVEYAGMTPSVFPPLAAEAGHRTNLPSTFTRFFGREKEITELQEMLGSPDTRLVTLTGPGGTGKTRLALEVAGRLAEHFQGAVAFAPLADTSNPALIADAVLSALRLTRSPQREPLEQVIEALSKHPSLLLLDNFEQLIEGGGAEVVQTLLERVPQLTLLVTSRQVLGLPGESEFALSPLPTPGAGTNTPGWTLERLSLFDSVALFIDRAQAAKPDFQITATNAPVIAEMCDRLEGIPLALELAAARAQVLTPSQMLTQMEDRFEFLASRRRGVTDRQKTLRGAVDWSYQLLSPELQRFFCRLSVFRGGWTAEAAEAVCEEPLALDYLAQLRECSLVLSEETEEAMRFRMLETLREFGWGQFSPEERVTMQRRQRDYFLERVEASAARQPLDISLEHDNIRVALACCQADEAGATKLSLRLAASMYGYWWWYGHWNEGRKWLEDALDRAEAEGLRGSREHASALLAAGQLASRQADHEAARALLQDALTSFQALGETGEVITTLGRLGTVLAEQGDYAAAASLLTEELSMAREDGRDFTPTLYNLGGVALYQGDLVKARALFEEVVALPGCNGYTMASTTLAWLDHLEGRHAKARAATEEILAGRRSGVGPNGGGRYRVAEVLYQLGHIAMAQADYTTARASFREGLSTFRELGGKGGVTEGLEAFASLSWAKKQAERAVQLFGAAERIRSAIGAPLPFLDRQRYEAHLAETRTELGDPAFLAAWEAGRSLTDEQAVAYALEEEHP